MSQPQGYYPPQFPQPPAAPPLYTSYPAQPAYPQPYAQPPAAPAQPLASGTLDEFYSQPSAGGGKSLAFKTIGTRYIGIVTRPIRDSDIQQQTDTQGRPQTFRDGRAKYVMRVPLQVQPSPEYPDGLAQWWVKGQARDDLVRAMAEVGAPAGPPEAGSVVDITYVADRPAGVGMNPAKQVRVVYKRPDDPYTAQTRSWLGLPPASVQPVPQQPQAAPVAPPAQFEQPPQQPPAAPAPMPPAPQAAVYTPPPAAFVPPSAPPGPAPAPAPQPPPFPMPPAAPQPPASPAAQAVPQPQVELAPAQQALLKQLTGQPLTPEEQDLLRTAAPTA